LVYKLDRAEFRSDTHRAKCGIEEITGQPILGYRAPTYSIISDSLWALEILVELGFTYDSSIFPVRHDRYGIPTAPRSPFRISTPAGPLTEFPLTTLCVHGHNLPLGGGGYLRLLPRWYTSWGLERVHGEGLSVITYVHPWEIDPAQPRLPGRLTSRLRHYTNLSKTYDRLNRMLERAPFTSFRASGLAALAKDFDLYAHDGHKNGRS
jgi:polysaccharide deacetylase family protein (PEP-CTERM system associated)